MVHAGPGATAKTEVQAMGPADTSGGSAGQPLRIVCNRAQPPRFVSEFESDIKRLYLRIMEEPVPARLLDILRAGMSGAKT